MIVALPLSVFLWDIHIENGEIRSNDFPEHNLAKLHGGEKAQLFFDEYADLRSYKDIKFYYRDSGRQISKLYNSWTVFVLDVYYEEEHFFETVNNILIDTDFSHRHGYDGEGFCEQDYVLWEDGFFECEIVKDEPLYKNNVAGFFIDPQHHTIRYCFIYTEKDGSTTFFMDTVMLSIDIPWNRKYRANDWAFDYPNP